MHCVRLWTMLSLHLVLPVLAPVVCLSGLEASTPANASASSTSSTVLPAATQSPATRLTATRSSATRRIETIEHDFGRIWSSEAIKHTFELTNTSDRVLEIRSVTTTCGCTTTSQWQRQVPPGATWPLEVSLSTLGRRGPQRKTVTVTTDDPNRPQVYLVVKADIRPRYEFAPSESISFGPLQAGTTARRTLVITNNQPEPVTIRQATPSTKFLKADLREIDKGKRYELDVQTVPPLPESGSLGVITLETDGKDQPKMTVPVLASTVTIR